LVAACWLIRDPAGEIVIEAPTGAEVSGDCLKEALAAAGYAVSTGGAGLSVELPETTADRLGSLRAGVDLEPRDADTSLIRVRYWWMGPALGNRHEAEVERRLSALLDALPVSCGATTESARRCTVRAGKHRVCGTAA
jgi:hypothetical protein